MLELAQSTSIFSVNEATRVSSDPADRREVRGEPPRRWGEGERLCACGLDTRPFAWRAGEGEDGMIFCCKFSFASFTFDGGVPVGV